MPLVFALETHSHSLGTLETYWNTTYRSTKEDPREGTKNGDGELKRREDGWEGQVDFTCIWKTKVDEANVDTSSSVESSNRWIRALEAWAG